jgi:hypothetical protein
MVWDIILTLFFIFLGLVILFGIFVAGVLSVQ